MKLNFLLFLLIALALGACTASKLANDPGLKSYIEIREGDEVALQWNYNYADKVLVFGFERIFANNDYILDRPVKSREYIIKVMNNSDTLTQTVYVKVIPKNAPPETKTDSIAVSKIEFRNDSMIVQKVASVEGKKETETVDTIPKVEIEKKESPETVKIVTSTPETTPEVKNQDSSDKKNDIKTGPDLLKEQSVTPSIKESEYFAGQISADAHTGPATLKVMRTRFNEGAQKAILDVVLLDRFGNYISGLNRTNEKLLWTATNICGSMSANYSNLSFNEYNQNAQNDFLDIAVLVDNSAASSNGDIRTVIKEFLPELKSSDNVMVSYFNQNYEQMIKLSPVEQTILGFDDNYKLPKKSGLNAINKACFRAIDDLSKGRSHNKALIVITYLSDNSSLFYDGNDVVKFAKQHDIPVYIIGVGEMVSGFDLRYITSLTGGRYYFLMNDETSNLKNILSEISFSLRNHYEVYLPVQSFTKECTIRKSDLSISMNDSIHSESVTFQNEYDVLYFTHQVLASFEQKSFMVKSEYDEVINSFAELLKENPDRPVQLIGYSWLDGGSELSDNMATQRAEAVKDMLIGKGVSADQIKVKNGGSDKPIYPLDSENWQKSVNRRVEVRWLDPKMLPYEILTETAVSEEEAQLNVEKWETRGYRSYYERSVSTDDVKYKIKLWGYSTVEDAQKASELIKAKYSQKCVVE